MKRSLHRAKCDSPPASSPLAVFGNALGLDVASEIVRHRVDGEEADSGATIITAMTSNRQFD
jgi:hypothetical protein